MMETTDGIKGGWIGIDLGTSNCTAAVWDLSRSRCKVLRLGHQNLARRTQADVSSRKGGKIVPSAVLFCQDAIHHNADESCNAIDKLPPSIAGYAAIQSVNATDGGETSNDVTRTKVLVTSFKRVVGMTCRQAKALQSNDPEFWNSLPFHAVVAGWNDDDTETDGNNSQPQQFSRDELSSEVFFDVLGDASTTHNNISNQYQTDSDMKEGVAIKIQPLQVSGQSSELLVTPLQVTTILLRAIRAAAIEYLCNNGKSKIKAPGLQDTLEIQNCVIGVPVHYSHAQRIAIQNAAKHAGFLGHVSVLTESTAAAMAYGLFVSSPNESLASEHGDAPNNEKNILVFDMGGGTTDVTIASIQFGNAEKVEFRVLATAGDRCLGGDNVDELLARYLWKRPELCAIPTGDESIVWKATEHQEFIGECRRAKEELCGISEDNDDNENNTKITETHVAFHGKTTVLTRQDFDSAIQPLVDRAEHVVNDALSALEANDRTPVIHEVVLVGGSTHIPTIRSMLRRKFPPPIPPELCTSLSAETAVAQGLAIQAALLSGLVPLWELRNAMMLDVLPHSIGVWVVNSGWDAKKGAPFTKGQIIQPTKNNQCQGYFVPILLKDAPLPAMGSATFTLASEHQSGVTVIAAEHIGPGDIFQCMGVFDFLLHRLTKDNNHNNNGREVKIGMTLETSGEFIVSIFDEKDPVHREKRRRYLMEKASNERGGDATPKDCMDHYLYDEEKHSESFSRIEITLALICAILFAFYVATKLAFGDIEALASDEM